VSLLKPEHAAFLESCRLGHLSTADASGRPHGVPVCFALLGQRIYIAIDEKPKRAAPLELKRVRNIRENPPVALVVDRYDEDWSKLGYVLVQGTATLLESGEEHRRAIRLLRERYPQYRSMALEGRPIIAIQVERVTAWGDLGP
jgi:PPOX class probable F420-dependent enzyme